MSDSTDPRIVAIRENPKIGRGSCTSIDEGFSDTELLELLDYHSVLTVEKAVKLFLDVEEVRIEKALNCRLGSDSDPELAVYAAWHKS